MLAVKSKYCTDDVDTVVVAVFPTTHAAYHLTAAGAIASVKNRKSRAAGSSKDCNILSLNGSTTFK